MRVALRNLIASIFFFGIFWFIYADLDNLENRWFMQILVAVTLVFWVYWYAVPLLVIRFRIRRRCRQNRERYDEWRKRRGGRPPAGIAGQKLKIPLEPGETAYWQEKVTFYAQGWDEAKAWPSSGYPSDVALPRFGKARYLQRTHVHFTDRRAVFAGKDLSLSLPWSEIVSTSVAPGGLVFVTVRGGRKVRLAFTCQNPLIVRDLMDFCRQG